AVLAVNLYCTLKREFGVKCVRGKVGVITPYRNQVHEIRRQFQASGSSLGNSWAEEVEISTVDAFQGREKDIILFSCVRAAGSRGIGFLADVRRMNVALTRAKFALFVLGSARALRVNPKWEELVELTRRRGALAKVAYPSCNLLTLRPVGGGSGSDGGSNSSGNSGARVAKG
ncbi:unnamed protein product, partial [Discosporangium mesarthrocarpum]